MKYYRVWTPRAILAWLPVCALLGLGPPVASVVALINGRDLPWHFVMACAMMPVTVGFIAWRRHDLHEQIRDSISYYVGNGTRIVLDGARQLNNGEVEAIAAGLALARNQTAKVLGHDANWKSDVHDEAFLILRPAVYSHRGGKQVRVGGLTYHGGPMVIEYTSDVSLLQDRARHEGCHWELNALGYADMSGEDHHKRFPELFP